MKDIYDILRECRNRRGENFALATLVRTEGSSYRRPGARMLICEDGTTVGSVSAGCLETVVDKCGREVFRTAWFVKSHNYVRDLIALAVVSEIQRVFGGGSGESLRERKLPIHAALERADRSALSKR